MTPEPTRMNGPLAPSQTIAPGNASGLPLGTVAEVKELRRVLNEQGVDDNGATPHSWRCSETDRYPGYCTCVDDIIAAILEAGFHMTADARFNEAVARNARTAQP